MKFVLAATGASGSIYMERLLARMDARAHEIHLVLSAHAPAGRGDRNLPGGELHVPEGVHLHDDRSMFVPFTSGSTHFDAHGGRAVLDGHARRASRRARATTISCARRTCF